MIETMTCGACGEVFAPYIVRPQFACPECNHQHTIPQAHLDYLATQRPPDDPDVVMASPHLGLYAKEDGIREWFNWKLKQSATTNDHQIEFRDDGWTVMHPLSERLDGSLFDCSFANWTRGDTGHRGRFTLYRNAHGELDTL